MYTVGILFEFYTDKRQRITTYPGTGQVVTSPGGGRQVVTCMVGHWYALNVIYHMYYNYTGVLWNIHRRLQHLQNISLDKTIDELGHFCPA